MSSGSGAGAPPPGGVVRSSALSFVAAAQPAVSPNDNEQAGGEDVETEVVQADRLLPAGLLALCEACTRVYPDQPNPLQITTRLKYWLGGNDPLDYISMYLNPGKPDENIPPHWHYVSFGLSDLHGDGRVHPPPEGGAAPSGYGFELTLRVCAAEHPAPPAWPAALLQALARYVFYTGNRLCAGDHVSWHRALDGAARGRVRHLLLAAEPQLRDLRTAHGSVHFLQIVGCTGKELRTAQRTSGFEVLQKLREDPSCGGSWLVTRLRRRSARLAAGPAPPAPAAPRARPAQLAGVAARVRWCSWTPGSETQPGSPSMLPESLQQQIKDTLQRGLSTMSTERSGPEGHMSTDSFEMSSLERALPQLPESAQGSWAGEPCVELPGAHVLLDAGAASVLPLALDARVRLGSPFTWRGCGCALSLLPGGAGAPADAPYVARGAWLQVVVSEGLAADMSRAVRGLARLAHAGSEPDSDEEAPESPAPPALPATLAWPAHRLKITVLPDGDFL